MPRHFLVILALCFFISGCTTKVQFPFGSPYPTHFKIEEGVVVSFPDNLVERKYSAKVGALLDQHVFRVMVFEAYRTETIARMNGLFTRGVTLAVHSTLQEIEDEQVGGVLSDEQRAAANSDAMENSLDKVLADLEARESGDKTIKKSSQELMDEALREAAKETVDQKNHVYLLKFRDALYGMPDRRVTISFGVQLVDRRTGAVLLVKRYQGLSPPFNPGNNNKTNEARLMTLTKQAFSGAMIQLVEDVAQVTGNGTPVQK